VREARGVYPARVRLALAGSAKGVQSIMRHWALWVILVVVAVSTIAWADVLVLRDGRTVEGTLVTVTSEHIKFRTAPTVVVTYPLSWVQEVTFAPRERGEVPLDEDQWLVAMSRARRSLSSCKLSRQGLVVGGLVLALSGPVLGSLGHGTTGELMIGLGAAVTLIGLAAPPPACGVQRDRVEVLTRIGLEFGWVF